MPQQFNIDRLTASLLQPAEIALGQANDAAVAAVLMSTDEGTSALLIRRGEHPQDPWSGHMAFPGGRKEARDESLLITAQRETYEEVGLDLSQHATLLGALSPVPAIAGGERAGFSITPFVFLLHTEQPLVLDSSEVHEALWAALDPLCRGVGRTQHVYAHKGAQRELPAFDIEGRVVWGLTFHMLLGLLRLGSGQIFDFNK
ncbi:MAG TPA: CoA pyrophosphatase [Polyangiaceae bacterium]|nr:CoA pyrophosphatase [Polyangiaceae bacterium]